MPSLCQDLMSCEMLDLIKSWFVCFFKRQIFVKEGTLMKVSRKSRQPRHLFLVNVASCLQDIGIKDSCTSLLLY